MKLTSKGMLKSLMLCAGMFSLSAVAATDYVADSFESGADQTLVRQWEPGGSGTGFKWTSSAGESAQDASKIVSGSVKATYTNSLPMDAVRFGSPADLLVLSLDTMGETLSRSVPAVGFSVGSTWVDTMVKFVKSEEDPTGLSGTCKAAVFANASSNLVVVSGNTPAYTVTNVKVEEGTWYRLTIEMGTYESAPAFRVAINGSYITYTHSELGQIEWFLCGLGGNNYQLNSVDFQGTGSIDQLVVTDVNPYAPTVILLSLTGLENADVTSTPAPTDGKIPSGTEITIAAKTGYVLSNVTFTNVVVDSFRFGQSLTFTPVGAADDVIAISTVATNAPVTFFGGKEVNAGKLATWLGTYANATTGSADYDSYLLNIDPANYPTSGTTFDIESIVVAADTATITLSFGSVDLANINGSLVIQKFTALGGAPTEVTVTPSATVEVDMTGYSFIKAVIK